MSKTESNTLKAISAVAGLILMAIPAWDVLAAYASDETSLLQLLLDEDTEELRASTKFFQDKYPGQPKRLTVEFFCPFSGRFRQHTFQENDEIDPAKLCSTHL